MNQIPQMKRVDSVDALRGFAVVAIMLLHFVEHFIYGVYPEATSKTAESRRYHGWIMQIDHPECIYKGYPRIKS